VIFPREVTGALGILGGSNSQGTIPAGHSGRTLRTPDVIGCPPDSAVPGELRLAQKPLYTCDAAI